MYESSTAKWKNIQTVEITGYTGTFLAKDGSTVTVTNGLIISVAP